MGANGRKLLVQVVKREKTAPGPFLSGQFPGCGLCQHPGTAEGRPSAASLCPWRIPPKFAASPGRPTARRDAILPLAFQGSCGHCPRRIGNLAHPKGNAGRWESPQAKGQILPPFSSLSGQPLRSWALPAPGNAASGRVCHCGRFRQPASPWPPNLAAGLRPTGPPGPPPGARAATSCISRFLRLWASSAPGCISGRYRGRLMRLARLKEAPPFAQRPFPAGLGVTPPSIPPPRPGTVCGWLRGAQRPCRARQTGALAGSGG